MHGDIFFNPVFSWQIPYFNYVAHKRLTMKNPKGKPAPIIFLFLLSVGSLLLSGCTADSVQKVQINQKSAVESKQQENQAATDTDLLPETSVFSPVVWNDAPPCENQPLSIQAMLKSQPDPAILMQASALTNLGEVQAALVANEGQNALHALALNVASGSINRSTRIDIPELPGVKTVGALLDQIENSPAQQENASALHLAAQQVLEGKGITQAVCANLYITQSNSQPGRVEWSSNGIQALVQPALMEANREPVKDTGQVSPDGRLAAFTSLGYETGGPVYLLDLKTQEWTDLIKAINVKIPDGQPAIALDFMWDVIGWFPDSRMIMIGPAELSSVIVVDIRDYSFRVYGFPSDAIGGSRTVSLSPDGSRFLYIGNEPDGGQAIYNFDLQSEQITPLLTLNAEEGIMLYPRFSPDGSAAAFLVQHGKPTSDMTYSLNLLSLPEQSVEVLTTGSLGATVPKWSPDGQYIAFTKQETDEPLRVIPEQMSNPMRGNVWVLPLSGREPRQVTFLDGWARSPVWNYDSRTLAFVTHDGQVGLVNITQPGVIWRAAQTSTENPLITSAFFVP
jgi:hypothetical protein